MELPPLPEGLPATCAWLEAGSPRRRRAPRVGRRSAAAATLGWNQDVHPVVGGVVRVRRKGARAAVAYTPFSTPPPFAIAVRDPLVNPARRES